MRSLASRHTCRALSGAALALAAGTIGLQADPLGNEARAAALAAAAATAAAQERPEHAPLARVPGLRQALSEAGPAPPPEDEDGETERVFGGNEAAPGAWPFQVALLNAGVLDDSPESQFYAQFCGGSVIAADWVLTAAHCVVDDAGTVPAEALQVLTGATLLTEGTRHRVAEVIPHPGYDRMLLDNDIALLRLADPTDAPPIALAVATPDSGTVWVTGWGMTEAFEFPNWLMEAEVALQANDACNGGIKEIYRHDLRGLLMQVAGRMVGDIALIDAAVDTVAAGFADPLSGAMLCAGLDEGKRDSCYGDSGGPLFALEATGPVQHGVVSWGAGPFDAEAACGHAGAYGVYARVETFRDWLSGHVAVATFATP